MRGRLATGNIPVGVMEDKTGRVGKGHPTLYAVLKTLPFWWETKEKL